MMKNKLDNFDQVLKDTLLEGESLSIELINKTREKIHHKEVTRMRPNNRKPSRWVASIAAALLLTSITAFATWQLLTPSEVASEFEDEGLTIAFDSEDAIHINETLTSEGYLFTLLSIVSGEDLTTQLDFGDEVAGDRTYAVIAIQSKNGTPMNESTSSFFVSPYISGFAPWQVNIASLGSVGGGHQEIFVDGVLYRIVDMANIKVFADHGVYLGISLGNFSFEAFDFDDEAGTLRVNPDFNGPCVLFELLLDSSLADKARAQELLDEIFFIEVETDDEVGIDDESEYFDFDVKCSGFTFCAEDEDGNIITNEDMTFVLMTYDELADFLEARIERDIENGEPEGVIVGGWRDRENWLRTMREYNIEFVEVGYNEAFNALSISWTNPDYADLIDW